MVVARLLRVGESRMRRRLDAVVAAVAELEDELTACTDAELAATTDEFRSRLAAGETLDDLLVEAFAVVRETSRRVLGMRHHDVQIMGGAALHHGAIAQMGTGEGKTLVATLPAYLNALTGDGVHVVTVNDYLATRDAEQMGQVYRFLGLSVAALTEDMAEDDRRAAYAADITHGTNHTFGFDYLRDHLVNDAARTVQRGHHFAIVDEVDSILIDEARTPLIISGPALAGGTDEGVFAALVTDLEEDTHYDVNVKERTVALTEAGVAAAESRLGLGNLYVPAHAGEVQKLQNALSAKALFEVDRDYVLVDGQVVIVDENTGRPQPDRRFSYGLHQALEAKHQLTVQAENRTMGAITLQNYFRLYDKLAGMTGTADTEAAEFADVYGLAVVPVPTHRPAQRVDHPDVIYPDAQAKLAAIVADVAARVDAGQPVLIGTGSVEASETVSAALTDAGVQHTVLNAKQHAAEAHLIAQAGRPGAVTVSTQMAGRGTDILLGGNPGELAAAELAKLTAERLEQLRAEQRPDEDDEDGYDAERLVALAGLQIEAEHGERVRTEAAARCAADREKVVAAGGLYVLGTERTESRRVDNQLRGRAGRQGDPGETRIYAALDDALLARLGAEAVAPLLRRTDGQSGKPISSRIVTAAVNRAQASLEARNFEARKQLLRYDEILDAQRKVVYAERRRLLAGEDMTEQVRRMLTDSMTAAVDVALAADDPAEWNLPALHAELGRVYPIRLTVDELIAETTRTDPAAARAGVRAALVADIHAAYDAHVAAHIGEEMRGWAERQVLMLALDRHWRAHLYEMDYLKESISLRTFAQRDPVVEYRREATALFAALRGGVRAETVQWLFTAAITPTDPAAAEAAEAAAGSPEPSPEPSSEPTGGEPAAGDTAEA